MRPSARRSVALVLLVLGPPVLLSGCATLAIPTVGSAAVGASGDALKAGASYTFGGWTYRTFSAPLVGVYGAARQTLARLDFPPPEEEIAEERVSLVTSAIDRTVQIDLRPITPAMTQLRVRVRMAHLGKDPSTSSELVAQTEATLLGSPAALPRPR